MLHLLKSNIKNVRSYNHNLLRKILLLTLFFPDNAANDTVCGGRL